MTSTVSLAPTARTFLAGRRRPALDDDAREPEPRATPRTVGEDESDAAVDDADDVAAVDRFQPPAPPPFPRPRTWQRGVAWAGIFVPPVLALVIGLLSVYVHPLFGWALVVWFVGGFLFLVREMPRGRDPGDDGSRI